GGGEMRRYPALDILRQRDHGRLLSAVLNPRYPHALRGIALMIAAVSTFTCLDTTSKYLAQHYPVPAIVWARYVVHMVLMALVLGPRMGAGLLRTTNLRLQLIRGVVLAASSLVFLSALRLMPLAEAAAIAFMTRSEEHTSELQS